MWIAVDIAVLYHLRRTVRAAWKDDSFRYARINWTARGLHNFQETNREVLQISVAAWSKEWVCRHSLPGSACSNSARGMDVCFLLKLYVLSATGLWDGPIAHPEKSYRMRGRLTERDLEMSTMMRPRPIRVVQPWRKRKIAYNCRRKVGLPPITRNDICRMLVSYSTFWNHILISNYRNLKKKKHKGSSVSDMLINKRLSQYYVKKDTFLVDDTRVFAQLPPQYSCVQHKRIYIYIYMNFHL